jgi:hypothetical protein
MVLIDKWGTILLLGMIGKESFANLKAFVLIGTSVASFSSFVYHLFGYTIPSIMWIHLKEIGAALIMLAVFAFAISWLLRAKPHKRPMHYFLKVYDVFGRESIIDGIRSEYKTYEVALSFMKEYKKLYPLYNFALVSDLPNSDRMTIFRYI